VQILNSIKQLIKYFIVFIITQFSFVRTGFCQPLPPSITGLPIQPTRTLSFTTDEGSYMSVDVSPDGKTLVFDLLGDLYTVAVTGGKAKQITRGMAVNLLPVWSPNGRSLAYISDISGSWHLNVNDIEGGFHRVLGRSDPPLDLETMNPMDVSNIKIRAPLWLPNGNYIYIHNIQRTVDCSAIYGLSGGNLIMDSLSHELLSFSVDGNIEYYIDSNRILELDRKSGNRKVLTPTPQNKSTMELSSDGRWLAYVTNDDTAKSLILRNTLTNSERILVRKMSKQPYDYKAAVPSQHFSFSPDSRYIFISYFGKIHRIDIRTNTNIIIPFEANVNVDMGALNYNTYRVTYDSIQIKYLRSINARPDGKQLVFSALNKIYVMDVPNGIPRLVVKQPLNQFQPAYSPDGKWIAYVSWSDTNGGGLWKVSTTGGRPQKLSKSPGLYYGPVWSPDGGKIAVIAGKPKLGGNYHYGKGWIQIIDSNGQLNKNINDEVDVYNKLNFSEDGTLLIYQLDYNSRRMLVSRSLETDSVKPLWSASGGYMQQNMIHDISISRDDRYIIYSASENLYLIPHGRLQGTQLIYYPDSTVYSIRFANGLDPYWQDGGKKLCWTYGNQFFQIDPNKIIKAAEKKAQAQDSAGTCGSKNISVTVEPDQIVDITLSAPASCGHGTIALTNVRIITMKENEVIENGCLLIRDGRIQAVGSIKEVAIPKGAKVMDLHRATIVPGLIDLHLHMYLPSGVTSQQNWMFLASLAYGVTTASDPSQAYGTFGYSELLRAGKMHGPRLFGAGQAVRPDFLIPMNNLDDARSVVGKRKTMGGILVKQYQLTTRLERQLLLMACKEACINMTNEGGVTPIPHIGMIKDGSTGIEHNTPLGEVYRDQVMLRAKSGTYWDPTLQVYVGSKFLAKDYMNWKYWRNRIDIKMTRFLPSDQLNEIKNSNPADSSNPAFVAAAKIDARVRHEGGTVVLGSHGNNKGTGPHSELWALQAGGLTNIEALQAATIFGATALGIQQDVGSLEVGKIADLIVLNKNPLEDIHNSREIRYVMKDGILYEGNTLDQIWPKHEKLPEWRYQGKIKQ
jgi:Tol biopolymer transport system component